MASLRTLVVAKTDIAGFTPRSAGLSEAELGALLRQHAALVAAIVARNEGAIIKGEGDAFWLTFPSVTAAVLAGIEIHRQLRDSQAGRGEEQRLALRMAIALGDVLRQENDIFGSAVNLTARIEGVTPPDEIYLSHAAWLALNKAEVPTAFVDAFALKGLVEPEAVYRVEQKHRSRVLQSQVIVFLDARGTPPFMRDNPISRVEAFLLDYDDLVKQICEAHGGIVRNVAGDAYILTFPEAEPALTAVENLVHRWKRMTGEYGLGLLVSLHRGDLHIVRSYVFGSDISTSAQLTRLGAVAVPDRRECAVVVSGSIADDPGIAPWRDRLQRVGAGEPQDQVTAFYLPF